MRKLLQKLLVRCFLTRLLNSPFMNRRVDATHSLRAKGKGEELVTWRHNIKFKGQTYVCKHIGVGARVSLIPSGSSSRCQKLAIDGGVAERWSASWPWLGGRSLPRWILTHIATSISFTRSWLSVTPVSARQHCSRDSARGDSSPPLCRQWVRLHDMRF